MAEPIIQKCNSIKNWFTNRIFRPLIPFVILFFILIFISSLAQPLLYEKSPFWWSFFSGINSLVCHQYETRCLHICGITTGICARCFSFYLSAILTYGVCLIVSKFKKIEINIILFYLMLLPLVVDGSTQFVFERESNNILRVLTGMLAGLAISIQIFSLKRKR